MRKDPGAWTSATRPTPRIAGEVKISVRFLVNIKSGVKLTDSISWKVAIGAAGYEGSCCGFAG